MLTAENHERRSKGVEGAVFGMTDCDYTDGDWVKQVKTEKANQVNSFAISNLNTRDAERKQTNIGLNSDESKTIKIC